MTLLAALLALLPPGPLAHLPVACIIDGASHVPSTAVIARRGDTIIMRAGTASACVRLGGIPLERLQ